jgi:hypothetical protein
MASMNYFLNLFLLEQSEFIYPRYKIHIYICFSYHLLTPRQLRASYGHEQEVYSSSGKTRVGEVKY